MAAGEALDGKLIHSAGQLDVLIGGERYVRQLLPETREGHPSAIDQDRVAPVALEWGEHFVARPPFVRPVVQQDLVRGIEPARDAHPLESRHLFEAAGPQ